MTGVMMYAAIDNDNVLLWFFLPLFLSELFGVISALLIIDKLMIKPGLMAKTGIWPVAISTESIRSVKLNSITKLTVFSEKGIISVYARQFKNDFSFDDFLDWLAKETKGQNIDVSDNLIENSRLIRLAGKMIIEKKTILHTVILFSPFIFIP
ncbi:MAG: hypothetical protein R3B47_20670 [Bacteroidia bacterium]